MMVRIKRDDFKNNEQPDIRPVAERGAEMYILYSPFSVRVNADEITVPRGFLCDGASSPRLLWTLTGFTRDGMHRAAAVIHDWLYHNKGWSNGYNSTAGKIYSRKECDKIFFVLLKRYGVADWKAKGAYAAVRALGWTYWRRAYSGKPT